MVKAQGVAKVDDKIVAQADIMCALMPKYEGTNEQHTRNCYYI